MLLVRDAQPKRGINWRVGGHRERYLESVDRLQRAEPIGEGAGFTDHLQPVVDLTGDVRDADHGCEDWLWHQIILGSRVLNRGVRPQ
jgi:hypothetical protein